MKASHTKRSVRFGDLIAAVYEACGRRKARGVLRLALSSHLVIFRDPHPPLCCPRRFPTQESSKR